MFRGRRVVSTVLFNICKYIYIYIYVCFMVLAQQVLDLGVRVVSTSFLNCQQSHASVDTTSPVSFLYDAMGGIRNYSVVQLLPTRF